MKILGWSEPNSVLDRVIAKQTVQLEPMVAEKGRVVINVPSASVLVAIKKEIASLDIYYECVPGSEGTDVSLTIVGVEEPIPPRYRFLGHFWFGTGLVGLYAKLVDDRG